MGAPFNRMVTSGYAASWSPAELISAEGPVESSSNRSGLDSSDSLDSMNATCCCLDLAAGDGFGTSRAFGDELCTSHCPSFNLNRNRHSSDQHHSPEQVNWVHAHTPFCGRRYASVCLHLCESGSVSVCVCVRLRALASACVRASVCVNVFMRMRVGLYMRAYMCGDSNCPLVCESVCFPASAGMVPPLSIPATTVTTPTTPSAANR
eukprot:GHVU01229558.1.p2 GENE.GHVU01229558.1~~GHVU01229558.1.p2  ORF type:complete len:207 (+),score=5.39 GHVU01229558.1:116-736(+)